MDRPVPSTAGRRQFNETAINKLMAEGVSRAVATAFVNQGIDKSGRYAQLRDHVCKMEYVRYLLPRTLKDYEDPSRIGRLSPYVHELKMPRFFTEFAMNDIECAKFAGLFPEFNVVCTGKTYNQHAFYANTRYAEAELLVGLVFEDARSRDNTYDPRSMVDIGGNQAWHLRKTREYVHCDNPVMSVRDIARYRVREVFSGGGGDSANRCNKTFLQCDHKADYAIAVHSTYDMTPRMLAMGMFKRGIKVAFGVIHVLPGIEKKPDGQYEVNGIVVTVSRESNGETRLRYTFKHDPAAEYSHKLSTLKAHLYSYKTYDLTTPDGRLVTFVYKIHSQRGNSIIFKMERVVERTLIRPDALWVPPRNKVYFITVSLLDVKDMEVDTEFFDRLVLQATGRRSKDYDILALYRYAKSLRQRVSINGIVLSSGYTMNPDQLVAAVVAAYAVGAAYRAEGAEFFKQASSQIVYRRRQGFWRDLFRIVGRTLMAPLGLVLHVAASAVRYQQINDRLKKMIQDGAPVEISVDKPHVAAGMSYDPRILEPSPKLDIHGRTALVHKGTELWYTPLMMNGGLSQLSPLEVTHGGVRKVYLSYALTQYGRHEIPLDSTPQFYNVSVSTSEYPLKSEEYRVAAYRDVLAQIASPNAYEHMPLALTNGDRLFRRRQWPLHETPALNDHGRTLVRHSDDFIVFRGVGSKAVRLTKPPCYNKGHCYAFVLLYEEEVSGKLQTLKEHKVIGLADPEVARAVHKICADIGVPSSGMIAQGYVELEGDSGLLEGSYDDLDVESELVRPSVSGPTAVGSVASREIYMTGARGVDSPPPSVRGDDEGPMRLVGAATPPPVPIVPQPQSPTDGAMAAVQGEAELFEAESGDDDAQEIRDDVLGSVATLRPVEESVASGSGEGDEPESVESEDIVWGRSAMDEQIAICEESEKIAIATGQQLIDLISAVARHEAPLSVWNVATQSVPGQPVPVKVEGDSWTDALTGVEVKHMAVTDGVQVYDRITKPPGDGIYVTSEVMSIYTGAAIKHSIQSVLNETYRCSVTNVDGVAGSGKTYTISHSVAEGDVILCETNGGLNEVNKMLRRDRQDWSGHTSTVDSFLMHRPVNEANTLWIDESLRLHAAKIFAVVKLLHPARVFCFGDSKQIPVLPFIPGFDLRFHEFPFTTVKKVRDTWRSPADVCLITSLEEYYGFEVRTHNSRTRSIAPLRLYEAGMFQAKPPDVTLLVYTQGVKHDLKNQGVTNVITIGESQGGTFDKVWVYRDSPLGKALYYSAEQTLVALTRHRQEFQYITAAVARDDSRLCRNLVWLFQHRTEPLLLSRLLGGPRALRGTTVVSAEETSSSITSGEVVEYPTDDEWDGDWSQD
ncbi:P1 protein [Aspergillus lentulus jivivirus 1]|nr:P1 protein [Aspergillus lentulus jivivirus 1]